MVQIELTQSGSSPRFLIRATDPSARLAVFAVQVLNENQDHTWIIGIVGSNITVHPASEVHLVQSRPATAEELEEFGFAADTTAPTAPIQEVVYGEVPSGFYQAAPVGGVPQPLVVGERYVASAVAGSDLGWLEFVA